MKDKKDATMSDVRQNRFYVGSNSVFDRSWGHASQDEAIDHAKRVLEDQGKDFTFVVKIVKVVKRAPRPTVVVDVK